MMYPLTGQFLAGRLRDKLEPTDLAAIEGLVTSEETDRDGAVLIHSGTLCERSMILLEGFAFRTIVKAGRRFVVGVHVPGDFVDLHGFALQRLDHNVVAAGPVRVGVVPHARLKETLYERAGVARALWFATLLDAAIHRKWIQCLEQLDAPRRIAHLYAELHARLEMIGRTMPRALRTPFTQLDLADMCGVSAIHANRAVARLREAGIGEIRRGDLYTESWDRLRQYANFDGSYLYGRGELQVDGGWK